MYCVPSVLFCSVAGAMAQQQGSSESAVNQAISNLLKYAPDRIGGGDRKADDEYLDVQPYQLL